MSEDTYKRALRLDCGSGDAEGNTGSLDCGCRFAALSDTLRSG